MRRLPGQAIRLTGRVLHRLVTLLLFVALGGTVLLAGLAWRLSEGPVELPWLAQRMQEAANADAGAVRVSIGRAELTWEGFRLGVDRPLDVRLRDVAVTDPSRGHSVIVPQVDVSLALGGLLLGRIQPRALEIDSPRLVLLRTRAGEVRLDFAGTGEAGTSEAGTGEAGTDEAGADAVAETGPSALGALIAELARPPAAIGSWDRLGRFSQLRRVRIRNSTLTVIDQQLAVLWRAQVPEIDLRRQAHGGVEGAGSVNLAMGAEHASVRVSGSLSAGDGSIALSARLSDLSPAALARQTGTLEPLEALDTRMAGTLNLEIGPHQVLRRLAVDLHAGPGKVKIGPDVVLIAGADLVAEGTDRDLALKTFSLRLLANEGGPVSTVNGRGTLRRDAGRVRSVLSVAVDHVAFADLPRLWPRAIARPAHDWITENITAGIVRDGHAEVAIDANDNLSDVALASATGSLLGEGVTVHWLRPVPPIDHGTVRLNILDADTFEILVSSGRQSLDTGHESGLMVKSGRMRISGITQKDQVATIEAEIGGPVADAVTLLRNKRLHLFDRLQFELNDPGGQLSGTLAVTLPLEEKLQIEDVPIQAKLHLQDAHFAGLVAGRNLDHGNVEIVASIEGMKLTGQAEVAGIPTQIEAEMNFRSGPPGQVVRRIVATGRATARQLAAAGLDAGEALDGNLALKAVVTDRRDGSGEILVDADLIGAGLLIEPIGWHKPAGQAAAGQARLKLRRGRLVGIDDITLDGRAQGADALLLRAKSVFAEGRIAGLTIDRAILGRTSGHGIVRFPPAAGPIQMSFEGASLDLSPVLSSKPAAEGRREPNQTKPAPAWLLDARFDQAVMANDITVSALTAHAESDGQILRALHVEARTEAIETGKNGRFRLDIAVPAGSRVRHLSAAAENAGELLRSVDVMKTMQGGRLSVNGTYDDTLADHPLSGSAEIDDFRIQGAPALGRLLQAMTLYGLVDVMQGPGLGFGRLVAPFRLTRDALVLSEARAFSSSLGITVKGRIDLAHDRLDLEGTIVPAYFFNSLLGNLPLVGKLFSPEEGGGLFAARYSIRGKTNDPEVVVNPLSALTPGFLRGVFGIF
jgi:hypothetical protein